MGADFTFPDDNFMEGILTGETYDQTTMQFLADYGISAKRLKDALQHVFRHIAIPYSPHRPAMIRQSELQGVLKHCNANFNSSGEQIEHGETARFAKHGSAPMKHGSTSGLGSVS